MPGENSTENVIDRLLLALAAQLDAASSGGLAAGAIEALTDLSRSESETIFGQAGLLVHYGADTEPLEHLISTLSAIQRREAPENAAFKPGDEVRLVGELPDSLVEYDEAWLRQTVFVVRFVGRGPTVDVQSDLTADYVIAPVPVTALRRSEE